MAGTVQYAMVATVEDGEEARAALLLDPEARSDQKSDHLFETSHRPRRDAGWLLAFVLSNAFLLLGGAASWGLRDRDFLLHVSPDYLGKAEHCHPGRSLAEELAAPPPPSAGAVAGMLLLAVGGALALGGLYLLLLRRRAMAAVLISVCSVSALCFLGAASALASPDKAAAGAPFVAGLLFLLLPCLAWRRLQLVARLLTVSGEGLAANASLFAACGGVGLASIAVMLAQLALLAGGVQNIAVVPSPAGADSPDSPCTWQLTAWGQAYSLAALAVISWTAQVAQQANVYTVAASIAAWYFAPPGAAAAENSTKRALGYAFRPSFGSLCLAGFALWVVSVLRACVRSLQQRIGVLAACLLQTMLSFLQLFTKFSTIRMAMTGEGFFAAAAGVRDLLARNMHDAYTVWWLPGFVLNMFSLIAAAAWGGATAGIVAAAGGPLWPAAGVLAAYLAWLVLAYVNSIVLSTVDTVFICWVMDCDRKTVTRAEVHEVFHALPLSKPGLAVQQPDGSYGYAPSGANAGHTASDVENATALVPRA